MKKNILIILLVLAAVAAWSYFIKGYDGIRLGYAVPERQINDAKVPGFENIRLIMDPIRFGADKVKLDIYNSGLSKPVLHKPEANILVISGGGANGAYSAGVLCGWTFSGDRPVFDIVTGVSTGALIAPCAFIGSSYDRVLHDVYTKVSDADIMRNNVIEFLFGGRPSIMDTKPLRSILEKLVTEELINKVADEHERGRRLYIATTNLDARRVVLWDMGAIASYRTKDALHLFRSVMLASASIPVAFPPVMIDVEAGGRTFNEMHVDGSVGTQLFGALFIVGPVRDRGLQTNVFLLRNGKIADNPAEVSYKIWDIAGASFSTMITWQSYGDLYRFISMAKKRFIKLYMTFIPYDFDVRRKGEFDRRYMSRLFHTGYQLARDGNLWTTVDNGIISHNVRIE